MYELVQVGKNTYYLDSPAKIGIYVTDEKDAFLIDSGNDGDAGKRIINLLLENQWQLKAIVSTHSHADHIGGNRVIQDRLKCKIYSTQLEIGFINNPILEPSFLYGGQPCSRLRNKFLMASPSSALNIEEAKLPVGFTFFKLPGHSYDMIGIKTSDNVVFLADSLIEPSILEKYHISYLYDVRGYLSTLDMIASMEADLFVPSHAEPTPNIKPLVNANRVKILEVINLVRTICMTARTTEEIVQQMFNHYKLSINLTQHVLIGSTIRSYLSYLFELGELTISYVDNKVLWTSV